MASTTYGSPYVQSSDLVSAWPTASLSVADRIDDVSFKGNGLNNQTASYTGVLTDAGKTVMMNVATANTFTIPASGSIAYELGTVLRISNKGAGTTTVQPNGGVTLNGGNISLTQYQSCEVQLVATDIWVATVKPASASGLTLTGTATFSAVSTISVNNCFSATYDWYKIVLFSTASTNVDIALRLRLSGTDATGANYSRTLVYGDGTSVATLTETSSTSYANIIRANTNGGSGFAEIFRPAIAAYTTFTTMGGRDTITQTTQGIHAVATAYDGLTLYPNTGNITGTVRIYGYQNS